MCVTFRVISLRRYLTSMLRRPLEPLLEATDTPLSLPSGSRSPAGGGATISSSSSPSGTDGAFDVFALSLDAVFFILNDETMSMSCRADAAAASPSRLPPPPLSDSSRQSTAIAEVPRPNGSATCIGVRQDRWGGGQPQRG